MAKQDINLSLSDTSRERLKRSFQGCALLPTMQEDIGGAHAWRLRNGGFCSFDRQRTNSPHIHTDGYEICLVLDGSGKYLHGDTEYDLGPGDLFLANPGTVHEISSHKTADLLLGFFVFFAAEPGAELKELSQGGAAKAADDIIGRFLKSHAVIVGGCEDLAGYMRLLSREGVRPSAGGAFGTEMLWRGFAFECLDRLSALKASPGDERKRELPPLDKAIEFIRANASHPIGVEDLGKAAGLSSRQLRRLFRQELGCEARDMIADARIQRSLHLLSMRFSVNDVAKAIGESSQAQFCRLFKRRVGITPKEYQRTHAPRRASEQSARPSRLR